MSDIYNNNNADNPRKSTADQSVRFEITFFPDVKAGNFAQEWLTLYDMERLLVDTLAERKEDLPLFKGAGFGRRYSNSHSLRHDGNVNWVTGVEGDYDDGGISFDEAKERLEKAGVHALLYTTMSHTAAKPRWRVFCPFSTRHPKEQRAQMAARLNGIFHGQLDPASFSLSQSFYFGHLKSDPGFRHAVIEGDYIDGCDELDKGAIGKANNKPTNGGGNGAGGSYGGDGYARELVDYKQLMLRMFNGENVHNAFMSLAGSLVARGHPREVITTEMEVLWDEARARNPRLEQRSFKEVEEIINHCLRKQAEKVDEPKPLILSSKEFVESFVPPDYLVERMLISSYLYALTGKTGSGKTAIGLQLAAAIALGRPFAGLETCPRRVLYLAGENFIDVQMRWIAQAQQNNFDADTIPVFFTTGVYRISQMSEHLIAEANRLGGDFGTVIVDTGPAFFEGDDESSRRQMQTHARMFRDLTDKIPGNPTVVVLCHPVKNATDDNLVPAGGGNFLNEIDGNLVTCADDAGIAMHWQGKWRGVEFNPLHFVTRQVTHERLKDKYDRLIPTIIADFIDEAAREAIADKTVDDRREVLRLIGANPSSSFTTVATGMRWHNSQEKPDRSKAQRFINDLIRRKLVLRDKTDDKLKLTDAGKEAIAE